MSMRTFLQFLLATVFLLTGTAWPSLAADEVPADLKWINDDVAGFVRIRPLALLNGEALREQRKLLRAVDHEMALVFERSFGFAFNDLESLTFIFPTPESLLSPTSGTPQAMHAVIAVRAAKPYDRDQVRKALAPGARAKKIGDQSYYFLEDKWEGLYFASREVFLYGPEDALVWLLQHTSQVRKHMSSALQLAAGDKHVVGGLNGAKLGKQLAPLLPLPLRPLGQADSLVVTADFARGLTVSARLAFANEEEAASGERALESALHLARDSMAVPKAQLEKSINNGEAAISEQFGMVFGLALLRELDSVLDALKVERNQTVVGTSMSIEHPSYTTMVVVSIGAITTLGSNTNKTFTPVGNATGARGGKAFTAVGSATQIGGSKWAADNNLVRLAKALDDYHRDKGEYPQPAIYGRDGEPLLSWRVALLPYLGQENLYKQFRLEEPWDSLHNKKLLGKMPDAFKATLPQNDWETAYLALSGPGAILEPHKSHKKQDITDDPHHTMFLVRVMDSRLAVPWTKPLDLSIDPDRPLPRISGPYQVEFEAIFADGSVRRVPGDLAEKTLRALISIAGGEKVTLPDR